MNLTNREYLEAAIASIRILKHHNSPLTHQERGILLSFPGGGILKECGVFTDADKPQWLVESREELRSLLTDEEWEGIRNSGMQNSHYTLPQIRRAMWEALLPLIPHRDGTVSRILDPGCGTAGFFWDMPDVDWLDYDGIDKDVLPVAIARKAMDGYPDHLHRVINRDFLQYDPVFPYQAAIGNVPFVNGVNSMKLEGKKLGIAIHAQFFVKTVQALAPGGVLCLLTSTTTLDAKGEDYIYFRRWLHRKCEFIGALRLPADAVHHGNTQVTTDLIMLRRRSQDSNEPDPNWIHVVESDLINPHYNEPVRYNQWFINNPQYLLGDRMISKVRGKNGNPTNCLALRSRPNFLKELREALTSLTQPTTNSNKEIIMAAKQVIIADDKFTKCSLLSFILIENPAQEGIEVHFPSDRNLTALTPSEETLLSQIKEQGFVPTQTHPHKFYIGFKKRTPDEYNRVIAYMRKKVTQCSKYGAKEIKIDDVESLSPCRVVAVKNAAKSESATTSAPIVDAIAARLQPMFDELSNKIQVPAADPAKIQELEAKCTEYLHIWQRDQATISSMMEQINSLNKTIEELQVKSDGYDLLKNELAISKDCCQEISDQKAELIKENENLRSQVEGLTAKIVELNGTIHELGQSIECEKYQHEALQQENGDLRSQLAEFGVTQHEPDLVDDEPDLQDEPDLDEPDLSDDDDDLPPAFQPQSNDDDEDEGGFKMELLGE